MPNVFVSHSHLDNAFGARFIADLRAVLGQNAVWYDVSGGLQSGDEWWQEIVYQITTCDVFLVILSPNAMASRYVRREMAMAYKLHIDTGKRLLPIRYQPCELGIDWDLIQWVTCRDPKQNLGGYLLDTANILTDLVRSSADGAYMSHPQPTQQFPPSLGIPEPTILRILIERWKVITAFTPITETPTTIMDDHFPTGLASLGYVRQVIGGFEVIAPPLCVVRAGRFLMGSDARIDEEAQSDEMPQSQVVTEAFKIARYPVTVAEYACAVRAYAVGEPMANGDIGWETQLRRLDHPVVVASWHDALEYVAWLRRTTGQPWRLPTEAEWEKAARWDEQKQHANIYPWGDEWDATLTNAGNERQRHRSPIGSTSPVGSYPNGASPYGAQDMAGNVWEWTSSLYRFYPYNSATSEDRDDGIDIRSKTPVRILRGGSWDSRWGVRCAFRYWNDPEEPVTAGIRLVLDEN